MGNTSTAILKELEGLGSESGRRVLRNHGARDPLFGVKVGELQKIRKRVGTDHQLALALFETGNYDAMYLAGLVADDARMTPKDLQRWVDKAYCSGIAEYTVAWVAAGSQHGWKLGLKWIDSTKEQVAAAGWATLAGVVAIAPDEELDLPQLGRLPQRVQETIREERNRVRYTMNGFLMALGIYVTPLTAAALAAASAIGSVTVDVGNTACKVPDAADYIRKAEARGAPGRKRKTVKC